MIGMLGNTYVWVKSAHVIFVIFWMAGLFMLPRFYVYHQEQPVGSAEDQAWIARERRLHRIILTPSLILVWLLGIALMLNGGYLTGSGNGWMHAKLLLVLILSGYHGWMSAYAKKLARGERSLSDKALRLANEVPGVVAIFSVILVIVRPF